MEYVSREDVDTHLVSALHNYAVQVHFIKKDNTLRSMWCTLKPELLPKEIFNPMAPTKRTNPDIQMVYDLEANAWRSFNKNSVRGYSADIHNDTVIISYPDNYLQTLNKEAQ